MVEKFFLSLDYETDEEAVEKGLAAVEVLKNEFGKDFVEQRVGVKINEDALTGTIDPRYRQFRNIFADKKISHGADTGDRILRKLLRELPAQYVTVSASMLPTILRGYVASANSHGIIPIAFTAHTKIPEEEIRQAYGGQSLDDVIYNLSEGAYRAGFHAVVMEGERLKNPRIRDLPIEKVVTGIRIDPSDKGTQSRVTALADLEKLKAHVDYVVVSSKYVSNPPSLKGYFSALL